MYLGVQSGTDAVLNFKSGTQLEWNAIDPLDQFITETQLLPFLFMTILAGFWMSIGPIGVAYLIHFPDESGRNMIDRVSQHEEIRFERLSRDLDSLRFHGHARARSDPLVTI
jgi:hypothetical protein